MPRDRPPRVVVTVSGSPQRPCRSRLKIQGTGTSARFVANCRRPAGKNSDSDDRVLAAVGTRLEEPAPLGPRPSIRSAQHRSTDPKWPTVTRRTPLHREAPRLCFEPGDARSSTARWILAGPLRDLRPAERGGALRERRACLHRGHLRRADRRARGDPACGAGAASRRFLALFALGIASQALLFVLQERKGVARRAEAEARGNERGPGRASTGA